MRLASSPIAHTRALTLPLFAPGYPDKWPLYEDAHVEPNKFFDGVASLRFALEVLCLRAVV